MNNFCNKDYTDYEKLKMLFNEFGINYDSYIENNKHIISLQAPDKKGKINGYIGFTAIFNFNQHDKFLDVGIWE